MTLAASSVVAATSKTSNPQKQTQYSTAVSANTTYARNVQRKLLKNNVILVTNPSSSQNKMIRLRSLKNLIGVNKILMKMRGVDWREDNLE